MAERLQPMLALLDQGLALYRRHFLLFVMLAAGWFVPVAVCTGLAYGFGARMESGWVVLFVVLAVLVLLVLLLYVVALLSRVATAAIREEPIELRPMLLFGPLRLVGMAVFSLVYTIVAYVASTLFSLICICPAYIVVFMVFGAVAAIGGNVGSTGAGILLILVMVVLYGVGLFISGALYSGLVYGLQPWTEPKIAFGVALQRSLELMTYRFWHNFGVWGLAGILLAAIGLTVSITIGVLVPLPLAWAFGSEAPLVQVATAACWLVGLVLAMPLLPIWMALLFQRNTAARQASDLQKQIDVWWQKIVAQPGV